ncbi:MAG TPA: hypothetical protein VHL59_15545, partial [Thermoanaerobaculia bacterium]|nr:hypothetical protein [Thermoanaerobaculia bacterium]
RATADHAGRYELPLEEAGHCIVAEATAAGASGRATAPAGARVTLDIRLDPPAPLTRTDAFALAALLERAVNENDQTAIDALAPHFLVHDDEAIRVGIEHLRVALGKIANARLVEERPSDYVFEIAGTNGATTRFGVQQYGRRIASNPMLYYGSRATHFLSAFARLVAANDAERLARLLTADEIDYPVDKARSVIARYAALSDLESARSVFTGIDERTSTLRYRIEGRRRDGSTVSVPIELGYGDGLLWLRE